MSSDFNLADLDGVPFIQVNLHTNVQLLKDGRIVWQNSLMGVGVASVRAGLAAAVRGALENTVAEFVNDEHFQVELH